MGKNKAEEEAGIATSQDAPMRTIGVAYVSASKKSIPIDPTARLTPLERHLGNRIKLAWRKLASGSDSTFNLAAAGVGTGVWADEGQDQGFIDRLRRLND